MHGGRQSSSQNLGYSRHQCHDTDLLWLLACWTHAVRPCACPVGAEGWYTIVCFICQELLLPLLVLFGSLAKVAYCLAKRFLFLQEEELAFRAGRAFREWHTKDLPSELRILYECQTFTLCNKIHIMICKILRHHVSTIPPTSRCSIKLPICSRTKQ